jgi:endonuclease G
MNSDPFQMQRELRYGAPVCDQLLIGRYFTIGYSWYFRQAKWVLEIVNRQVQLVSDLPRAERLNNFRADSRISRRFRASLEAYTGNGYDRGHLASSANHDRGDLFNSETFLMSNMSPQKPEFNRKKWKDLEEAVRELDAREDILETFVLTCPVFYFNEPITTIGDRNNPFGIDIPVPHAFVKSVLAEDIRGAIKIWTFEMRNEALTGSPESYLVKTYDAEQKVGGRFWDRVNGADLHEQKSQPGKMWSAVAAPPRRRRSPPASPPVTDPQGPPPQV